MPLQLELRLDEPRPAATLTEQVRLVMLAYEWITLIEIQREVLTRTGELHSDSSISARVRELRHEYTVIKRKKENSRQWEYRLEGIA